jgi:hypothetical protein
MDRSRISFSKLFGLACRNSQNPLDLVRFLFRENGESGNYDEGPHLTELLEMTLEDPRLSDVTEYLIFEKKADIYRVDEPIRNVE